MNKQGDLMRRLIFAIPFVVAAGCGGGGEPAPKTVPPATKTSITAEEARQGCVDTLTRFRTCTDDFIPALVAMRVKLDLPAGIAAKDAEIGRDALVAGAKTEWAEDSKDEAIAATCEGTLAKMPQELIDELVPVAAECQSKDACPAYVECMMPIQEKLLTSAPKQ
jgi:hypothetical protein